MRARSDYVRRLLVAATQTLAVGAKELEVVLKNTDKVGSFLFHHT
jgi:hypothetical protein